MLPYAGLLPVAFVCVAQEMPLIIIVPPVDCESCSVSMPLVLRAAKLHEKEGVGVQLVAVISGLTKASL